MGLKRKTSQPDALEDDLLHLEDLWNEQLNEEYPEVKKKKNGSPRYYLGTRIIIWVMFIGSFALGAFVASTILDTIEVRQPSFSSSDEKGRIVLPSTNPWQDQQILDQKEALLLRTKPNVVNLAMIQPNGSVLYSQTSSLLFTKQEPWRTSILLGLETVTTNHTYVDFIYNGERYSLNVFQPFTIISYPDWSTIYVFDESGVVWSTSASSVSLTSIAETEKALPFSLPANPSLSLSYK